MGLAIVAAIAIAIAMSMGKKSETIAIKRAVNAPGLMLQDVVAGLVAAQNTSAETLDKIAASVPGTNFARTVQGVAALIRAKNLPAGTQTMSGALAALVTFLYYETEPVILSLYAEALEKTGQSKIAESFRSKASSSTRSMVLYNPVTGESASLIPPALKAQVDAALASKNADQIRAAAAALSQAGFQSSAEALLAKV